MEVEIRDKGTNNETVIIKDIQGDMGETARIQLLLQPDGDVILSFYDTTKKLLDSIEFCTSSGGGRDPRIASKLRELIKELADKDSWKDIKPLPPLTNTAEPPYWLRSHRHG
jgi:hypothetical protein